MRQLERWDVEDPAFWSGTGKSIANRNLWISVPNLLCGFAVWLFWSVIIVKMQELHEANKAIFNFTFGNDGKPYGGDAYRALLYLLPAVGGLAGATLRIPNSFMIAISGGRNVIAVTSLLLVLPALGTGIALQDPNASFLTFIVLATLSGIGGGAFASSMSNISFFFPKRVQGTSLGINAGLGNLGVSVMQVLLPWVVTFGLFGALGGDAHVLTAKDGTAQSVWIQNCGLVWVPVLVFFAVLAWFGMDNLPQHGIRNTAKACGAMLWLELLGLVGAGLGVFLLLSSWGLEGLTKVFVVLVIVVPVTLALMRYATPGATSSNLRKQFQIFRNKHNWIMTWLYIMTFGSFIGYSAAFPKLIKDVFGYVRVDDAGNLLGAAVAAPNAPNPLHFAWLGPLVGSLIRPVGGWLSDKLGGARVTHWDTIVMIGAALGVGYFVHAARTSPDPQLYFLPFLVLFLVLFVTTGIGNGSTFRMVPIIFKPEQAGPVLGWTSAIAAYGAYLIPNIFGGALKAGTPEVALYGFAGYYVTCLGVNWWFYARKNAEIPC
jgi:NNP family nitrate/nitrite transporter-like MFS transporter